MSFAFEKLVVYQRSVDFYLNIYQSTKTWRHPSNYPLIDQVIRAALSIPLNIAEGSSRSKKDFQHFLSIARGSCYECIPLITIAEKLKLITLKEKEIFYNELQILSKMLSSLRNKI